MKNKLLLLLLYYGYYYDYYSMCTYVCINSSEYICRIVIKYSQTHHHYHHRDNHSTRLVPIEKVNSTFFRIYLKRRQVCNEINFLFVMILKFCFAIRYVHDDRLRTVGLCRWWWWWT